MNTTEVKKLYLDGHEVGAHTRTHPFLTQLTATQAINEIAGSRQDLISAGMTPADTMVYPYGDYNDAIIQDVKNVGYLGARSVNQGYNTQASNKYALYIQSVGSGTTVPQMESWIQAAMTNHTWVIFMFHQIDHSGDDYSTTPENLQALSAYIKANSIPTVTMREGLQLMNP